SGSIEVVLTQDPDVVHRVARHLIRRIPAPGADNEALLPSTSGPIGGAHPSAAPARSAWRDRLGRRA
ncbi:MAG TPA: hypothetical protein VMV41_09230, partial [Cellulomonadaceae bacterium]|nr:hypothetical protein [Cellulomonadaceae bacterium]